MDSTTIARLMAAGELAPPLPVEEAEAAARLGQLAGLFVYPDSIAACAGTVYFLGRREATRYLGLLASPQDVQQVPFAGQLHSLDLDGSPAALMLCPTDHTNARALRAALPFTAPRVLGLQLSIGCGDRLGLATPGHVRAVRRGRMAPIFAQQSIREMTRTRRTPEEVLDAATWGVFEAGWRGGFGADADHLKTVADVERCVAAGYTFYTVDPGDFVDGTADLAEPSLVRQRIDYLPWSELESTPEDLRRAYLARPFDVDGAKITIDEDQLWRAAAKYGAAIAHTLAMYRQLSARMAGRPFELEMSVDETGSPTTPEQHYFIASELRRLGVRWISLAPRFVGRFEKGVDYIGDLAAFEADIARQAAIARALGPYKLGLHSGSDKFSIYPIMARLAGQLVHLKTAGTSYLEAVRVLASLEPPLFRQIAAFARQHYSQDSRSYHVSADPARLPAPEQLADSELASLLDTRDGRQVLHVTFGSVLTAMEPGGGYLFRDRLLAALQANEQAHYAALAAHFERHIAPFS
jgi:hypothetical protein